jgi:hypothetical protein
MNEAALPLQNRRVFGQPRRDATHAFMASKEFKLELAPRETKAFDFIANIAYMPAVISAISSTDRPRPSTFPTSAPVTTSGCTCRCTALARSPTGRQCDLLAGPRGGVLAGRPFHALADRSIAPHPLGHARHDAQSA